MPRKPKAPPCIRCAELDARERRAKAKFDRSAETDVRVLRGYHAPECEVQREAS